MDDPTYVTMNTRVQMGLSLDSIAWAFNLFNHGKIKLAPAYLDLSHVGLPTFWVEPWNVPHKQCILSCLEHYTAISFIEMDDQLGVEERIRSCTLCLASCQCRFSCMDLRAERSFEHHLLDAHNHHLLLLYQEA